MSKTKEKLIDELNNYKETEIFVVMNDMSNDYLTEQMDSMINDLPIKDLKELLEQLEKNRK